MAIPLSQYRPWNFSLRLTDFTTQVEADDNNDPTNWVSVFTHTMPLEQAVNATYTVSISWFWSVDSVSRSAYFRLLVDGVPTPNFLRIESGDEDDLNDELFRIIRDFDGTTDIDIEVQCVLENIGGTDTLTIPADSLVISIEAKKNI